MLINILIYIVAFSCLIIVKMTCFTMFLTAISAMPLHFDYIILYIKVIIFFLWNYKYK